MFVACRSLLLVLILQRELKHLLLYIRPPPPTSLKELYKEPVAKEPVY